MKLQTLSCIFFILLFSFADGVAQILTVTNIPLPDGYKRTEVATKSFGSYLRQIELKKDKTVYLFDGRKKMNQTAQYAVLNISVGLKDLQQCADAVMRLRAEYLRSLNLPICFTDNANKKYCWSQYQHKGWQSYLETVYGMCGTLSLEKQLKKIKWADFKAGDVIIKGGSPGHAVIIIDVATHQKTGEQIFLLAQSYMPAQDVHILLNKSNSIISPWYRISLDKNFKTPEWIFQTNQLHTW
jgi:Domain of unknown function (4846)